MVYQHDSILNEQVLLIQDKVDQIYRVHDVDVQVNRLFKRKKEKKNRTSVCFSCCYRHEQFEQLIQL